MTARDLKTLLGEDIWSKYFKFSIIRNPYEKAISAFFFQKHWHEQTDYIEKNEEKARTDFNSFIEQGKFKSDRGIYIIDGQSSVDHMLRYEHLTDDLARLSDRLSLGLLKSMPVFKTGIRPKFATIETMITPNIAAAIETECRYEFDTFGYKKLAVSG